MAFEIKVLGKIRCPRCNAMAELRIDQKPPKNNWIFVYVVCSTCRLIRYSHVTTRKSVKLQSKINKLKKNVPRSKALDARITKLEEIKRGAENNFD